VQTGDPKHIHTKSEKRESMTRVNTSLGHFSATCQHPIGPPQPGGSHHYTDLTCGSHQHATWQALTGPPHPPSATWQHCSNTPHFPSATWQHCSNTPQHPSAIWQLAISATSQWTKTHGIHCLMPPQHTLTLTKMINGIIKQVDLSDCAKSDQLNLSRKLTNPQLD
jgi:hypothetical protein